VGQRAGGVKRQTTHAGASRKVSENVALLPDFGAIFLDQ
jgi:hypothetical protein